MGNKFHLRATAEPAACCLTSESHILFTSSSLHPQPGHGQNLLPTATETCCKRPSLALLGSCPLLAASLQSLSRDPRGHARESICILEAFDLLRTLEQPSASEPQPSTAQLGAHRYLRRGRQRGPASAWLPEAAVSTGSSPSAARAHQSPWQLLIRQRLGRGWRAPASPHPP